MHDRLIVYENQRGSNIFETQDDPSVVHNLKGKGYGYLTVNLNKRLNFKIQYKFYPN